MAILLTTVPVLYASVKFLGAAYLIWLGSRYLMGLGGATLTAPTVEHNSSKTIIDSIIVEALNPKTALFYLAFLPQFTDISASAPVWAQVLVLGAIVNIMFSITDALCIELSQAMTKRLAVSEGARRLAQCIGGSILIALGIKLAVSRQ